MLQVAAHPEAARAVGRYLGRVHLADAFAAESQAMAVLTRADVARPTSIGLVPPTADYVDLSPWRTQVPEASTVAVWHGLEAGRYDSGITLKRFHRPETGAYRVEAEIPPVRDAWLVYGLERPPEADSIWPDGPAARLIRAGACGLRKSGA